MRYFLALFVVGCVLTVLVAGRRGDLSRKPPLEVFPDMDRQLKLRPQTAAGFSGWEDGRSSRLPVAGTVARTAPIELKGEKIHTFDDNPLVTGREPGKTNHVDSIPLPVTAKLMARGRERYEIHCVPCHGALGDGNGVVKRYGHGAIPSLADEVRIAHPDGYIYSVIRNGSPSGVMGPYGAQIGVEDRWAIVAYVRALQLARLGTTNELPETLRASLK